MYVSGQGYLWWRGGQGAPSIKVRALRALIDLNGHTWGLPLHPGPGAPFQLHPAASGPAWVMSYGMLVSSSAIAAPVLGHRCHWLGLWAADWLLDCPGTCFVTVDLTSHQQLCLTLVMATRPNPDPDPNPGIHFPAWPWTCLTTTDLSDELDSWLTLSATHERALLPRSGAMLSHLAPASLGAVSLRCALTVEPSSLLLGSSWVVMMVHDLWYSLYSLLSKPQGQVELYHAALAPYRCCGAFFMAWI